jgi:hypothetical protein
MTGLHGPYAPSRLASEHHDPAISGANMLQSVDGHGPLRDLSLIVAGALRCSCFKRFLQ